MTIELPRDRHGRPLILQPDGSTRPYTRASQVGDTLDDKTALTAWEGRMVVKGVAESEHIRRLISLADITDDKALGAIARKAKDAAGAWSASDLGTAIHKVTERLDTGDITINDVTPEFRPHIVAYQDALARVGFTPVLVEAIVVNDELEIAGTLDRVYETPAGDRVVGDLKTGKQIFLPSKSIGCQLAAYAHSVLYDPETGERTPIEGLRTDTAYVVHLPANGSGCSLYEVDTRRGFELARLAQTVRRIRNERLIRPIAS
jgi:hypothetical protein